MAARSHNKVGCPGLPVRMITSWRAGRGRAVGYLGTFLRAPAQKTASRKTLRGSTTAMCTISMRRVETAQKAARVASSDRPRTTVATQHSRPTTVVKPTIITKNLPTHVTAGRVGCCSGRPPMARTAILPVQFLPRLD